MPQVPSMWRDELWHPKVVHFSVALLVFGALLYLAYLAFYKKRWRSNIVFAARVTLVAGVLASWASIVTGNMADSVVGREICDPLVLEEHAYYAYALSYLFTGAVIVDFGLLWVKADRIRFWGQLLVGLACLAGAGLVVHVGHLGGKLVYQQGAAVYEPSDDCAEFEN